MNTVSNKDSKNEIVKKSCGKLQVSYELDKASSKDIVSFAQENINH